MNIWIARDHEDGPQAPPFFRARSRPMEIQRLVDRRLSAVERLLATARESGQVQILDAEAWNIEEIPGPNVTDKETILTFAKMTLDAYTLKPFSGEWQDVKGGFNYSQSFGWEGDGLRGHIYADKDNSTIVIGLKGTSAGTCPVRTPQSFANVPQLCLMVPGQRQMIRLTITCSSAAVAPNRGAIYGNRYAIAERIPSLVIRHVSSKRSGRRIAITERPLTSMAM